MNIFNNLSKIYKTYTVKISADLICIDLSGILYIIYLYQMYCKGLIDEFFLVMSVFFYVVVSYIFKFSAVIITFLLEVFYIKPDYDSIYINKKMMILETISIVIQLGLIFTLMIEYIFNNLN